MEFLAKDWVFFGRCGVMKTGSCVRMSASDVLVTDTVEVGKVEVWIFGGVGGCWSSGSIPVW